MSDEPPGLSVALDESQWRTVRERHMHWKIDGERVRVEDPLTSRVGIGRTLCEAVTDCLSTID